MDTERTRRIASYRPPPPAEWQPPPESLESVLSRSGLTASEINKLAQDRVNTVFNEFVARQDGGQE